MCEFKKSQKYTYMEPETSIFEWSFQFYDDSKPLGNVRGNHHFHPLKTGKNGGVPRAPNTSPPPGGFLPKSVGSLCKNRNIISIQTAKTADFGGQI